MGKKTILRVEDGIQLSETQLKNLKDMIGGDLEIQDVSLTTNLQRSYQLRATSFENAFRLIVKSIPRESTESFDSESYLKWIKDEYRFTKGLSRYKYQQILKDYTCKLLDALVLYWLGTVKLEHRWGEAIEMLNKSEQYYLMMNGRSDLATLTRGAIYQQDNLILQWEKQLKPLTEETLAELYKIKAYSLLSTPGWFRELPSHQQVFFHGLSPVPSTVEMLKSRVNDFIMRWNDLKKEKGIAGDLLKIKSQSEAVPTWFSSLPSACGAFLSTVLKSSVNPEVEITEALIALNQMIDEMQAGKRINWTVQLASLNELPFWFICLPAYEQQLLKHALKSNKNIDEVVSFLPSRLGTLPGMRNFCESELRVLDHEATTVRQFPAQYRSSHGGSRDVKDYPEQVSRLHTQRNAKRISEITGGKNLLLQTLISPVPFSDRLIPDRYLEEQRQIIVKTLRQENKNRKIFTSNHPFNVARYILWTSSSDSECRMFLDDVREVYADASCEKQIQSLTLPEQESKALSSLMSKSINFIENNKNPKDYFLLCTMANQLDISRVHLSTLEWQILVQQALNESKSLLSSKQMPAAGPTPLTETPHVRQALIHLFCTTKVHFNWLNWQSLFAEQLYWNGMANKSKAACALLKRTTDLALLANEYDATLNSGLGSATFLDYNGRELFLSSQENLLITHRPDGVSYGSCVSGKDRKVIESIHTKAMLLFRDTYGYWPSYRDTGPERTQFVNLVASLYLSGHPHEHAGQNAPGSDGVKNPGTYLPKDIAHAICTMAGDDDTLARDDFLASNNEVKCVIKAAVLVDDKYPSYIEAAKKLDEKDRNALLDKLKALSGERNFWHNKTTSLGWTWSAPKGITRMKKILDQHPLSTLTQQASTSETVLAQIYKAVRERPVTNKKRDPITQKIYELLITLYVSSDPRSIVAATLKQLDAVKDQSYLSNADSTLKM